MEKGALDTLLWNWTSGEGLHSAPGALQPRLAEGSVETTSNRTTPTASYRGLPSGGLMWWFPFLESKTRDCAPVVRLSQPLLGSLLWGATEKSSADCQTSDSGRAAWISPWLSNGRPALHPLVPAGANRDFANFVYMCFVDLEKAYNQVSWGFL